MKTSFKFAFVLLFSILLSCNSNKDDIKFGDNIDDFKDLVQSSDELNIESEYGTYEYRTLIVSGGCTMLGHAWPRAECSFSNGKLYKVEFKDKSPDKSYVEDVRKALTNLCGEESMESDHSWNYGTQNHTGYEGSLYINTNSGKVRVYIQTFPK